MTPREIEKAVRAAVGNGFMSEVKLAIVEALEPIFNKMNNHDSRIKALEVKEGGVCVHHEEMNKKTHKAFANNWIMHAQWFVITILVGIVAYMIRNHL